MGTIKKLFDGYYKMFSEEQSDGYNISWASRNSIPFKEQPKTDCVTVVAVRPTDWTVPVLRQYRPALGDYIYEFPAGKVDSGETPVEAAKRELLEETGLILRDYEMEIPMVFPSAGMIDECHSVVCGFCDGEPNLDNLTEHEDITIEMLKPHQLIELVESNKFMSLGIVMYVTGLQNALIRNYMQNEKD